MGAFNPERAQEIQGVLMMMEFEGKEQVEDYVKQGQTLLNMLQQAQMQIIQYEAMLGILPQQGSGGTGGASPSPTGSDSAPRSPITDGVMQAQAPRAPYAERLAKRSTPSVG